MTSEFFKKLDHIIPFKWRMVGYLGFLLILSSVMLKAPERILNGVIIVAVYAFFDVMWTKIRDGRWYVPVSSFISGLIIALIANPTPSWWFLILAPLVAVFSKQILRFPGKRHIFNPAAFSLVTLSFFSPDLVSWWGVSWGKIPLVIVILAGLVILFQLKRFHESLPFLFSYGFFLSLLILWLGSFWETLELKDIFTNLQQLPKFIFDGTVLFFATVMLIEPITSQFPTRNQRIFYALSIAFFSVIIPTIFSLRSPVDPLLFGLVLGNFLSYILFIIKTFSQKSIPNPTSL